MVFFCSSCLTFSSASWLAAVGSPFPSSILAAMLSSQPLSPGAGGFGMVDLLALLVTVPRDCITLTEFLVFLILGVDSEHGVESEHWLERRKPC